MSVRADRRGVKHPIDPLARAAHSGFRMPLKASSPRRHAASAPAGPDRLHVQSVARAFALLEAFAASPRAMSLSQLAAASGMDKSGVQRLAHTMLQLGYLEQGESGLRPGPRLLERSADYLRWNPLVARALPVLVEFGRETQEGVDFSLFDDLTMLYVLRLQSRRTNYYAALVGGRVPTFCTSTGHAVLARLPDDAVLDILSRSDRRKITSKTVTEPDRILRLIRHTRAAGYSLAGEQIRAGEISLAAAVTDRQGRPVAAVRVAGSLGDWTPEEFERRFAAYATRAAEEIGGH